MEKHDLRRLVERCQRKDPEAWARLVERFSDFVYSVARRHRLNDEDAGDVFQATFQSLLANIDRIEDPLSVPKWLAVTASRASLRTLRNRGRHVSIEDEGHGLSEVLATEEESAEAAATREADALALREAVARLGGKCTELLTLLYLTEDTSYQTVTETMAMPTGTIGPTRARCLEKLRRALESDGFFP